MILDADVQCTLPYLLVLPSFGVDLDIELSSQKAYQE